MDQFQPMFHAESDNARQPFGIDKKIKKPLIRHNARISQTDGRTEFMWQDHALYYMLSHGKMNVMDKNEMTNLARLTAR